jgi:hypothetical protein
MDARGRGKWCENLLCEREHFEEQGLCSFEQELPALRNSMLGVVREHHRKIRRAQRLALAGWLVWCGSWATLVILWMTGR